MKRCAVLLPTLVLVFSSLLVNAAEPVTKPATQTTQAATRTEPPEKYIALGQEAMHQHKWEVASRAFSKAIELGKRDPALQMLLADSLREQENTSLDGLRREIAVIKKALEIDPDYQPALQGLVRVYQLIVTKIAPTPQYLPMLTMYLQKLDKCAARLHELDPANPTWVDAQNQSLLRQWIMKLDVNQAALAAAMSQLTQRLKVDASDADIPSLLAQVDLQQADDLRRATPGKAQTPEVTKLYENAVAVFETAIATEQAQNARCPELHVKFSRLLEMLAAADKSDAKNAQMYVDQCNREMARAQAEVTENEPLYISIGLEAASLAQRQGKLDDAEKILRGLPDTDDVEMQLAKVLESQPNPSALPQAMDLLERLVSHRGGEDAQVTPLNFPPLLMLTRVRLRRYEAATDPAEKKRLMATAIAAMDRMKVKYPDDVDVVYLLGEIDMLQGNPVAAIQRLRQATELHPDFQHNWPVMCLLALAYDAGNQTSAAVETLKCVLGRDPANLDALRNMVRILVRHDPAQAHSYLDELEKRRPDDPQVIDAHLQLLAKAPNPDPALVRTYFDCLPESTPAQIDAKLHQANSLRLWDDAIRLESGIVKAQPNNAAAALDLARYYLLASQRDQAAQVITDALKANPDNDDLRLFQAQTFRNASPDEVISIQKDKISRVTDPLKQELAWAELYERLGDQEQYAAHLIAAEKIAPNSPILLAKLFDNALANNRLEEAEKYCRRITALNADNAHGLLYQIRLATVRKDNDLALKLAKDLVFELPEFAQAWLTLGQVQQARGEYEEALKQYKAALDRQADNTTAMKGLVQCYDALKRHDEALPLIQKLKDLHADSDVIIHLP